MPSSAPDQEVLPEMHIDKWVSVGVCATVFSTVFSGWSAYRSEYPHNPSPIQPPAVQPEKDGPVNNGPSVWFWLMLLPPVVSSLFLGFALIAASRKRTEPATVDPAQGESQTKLKIDSAYYGLGNANDVDVTERLQKMPRNALSVWVGNNLIPGISDPAPGQVKQLTVHYSFGVQRSAPAVIPENRQLVLPRDLDWAREFGLEYERQRIADVAECEKELRQERKALQRVAGERDLAAGARDDALARATDAEYKTAQEKERVRLLELKLAVWSDASVVYSLEADAKRLRHNLSNLNAMAEQPENKQFAALIAKPLSDPLPLEAGDETLRTLVWRFQKDFSELRDALSLSYKSLELNILTCTLPSGMSNNDVDALLKKTALALSRYADGLFSASEAL